MSHYRLHKAISFSFHAGFKQQTCLVVCSRFDQQQKKDCYVPKHLYSCLCNRKTFDGRMARSSALHACSFVCDDNSQPKRRQIVKRGNVLFVHTKRPLCFDFYCKQDGPELLASRFLYICSAKCISITANSYHSPVSWWWW